MPSPVTRYLKLVSCSAPTGPLAWSSRLRAARDQIAWIVTAEGPRLRKDLPAWQALGTQNITVPESAAEVQFTLLASLLSDLGRPLSLDVTPEHIEARF